MRHAADMHPVRACRSATDAGGYQYTSVVKIRDELTYQWAFEDFQVRAIIFDMRNAGLLGYGD